MEICSACHPFFTGKQHLDTAGRIDRFPQEVRQSQQVTRRPPAQPCRLGWPALRRPSSSILFRPSRSPQVNQSGTAPGTRSGSDIPRSFHVHAHRSSGRHVRFFRPFRETIPNEPGAFAVLAPRRSSAGRAVMEGVMMRNGDLRAGRPHGRRQHQRRNFARGSASPAASCSKPFLRGFPR